MITPIQVSSSPMLRCASSSGRSLKMLRRAKMAKLDCSSENARKVTKVNDRMVRTFASFITSSRPAPPSRPGPRLRSGLRDSGGRLSGRMK